MTLVFRDAALQASARQDWDEAVRLWSGVHDREPEDLEAVLQLGEALWSCDRLDEADRIFGALANRVEAAAVQHAWLAQNRKDWTTALERWANVRSLAPGNSVGYTAAASAMWQLDRLAEGERLLAAGMAAHPDDSMALHFAWSATVRHDWEQAILRWRGVLSAGPADVTASLCLGEALVALGRFAEWERDVLPVAKRHPKSPELREQRAQVRGTSRDTIEDQPDGMDFLCAQFESLGEDCEFALLQRHFGAEPVSLLRWGRIALPDLVRALDSRFAGLGEGAEFVAERRDYVLREAAFAAEFYSFVAKPDGAGAGEAAFAERMCRRLRVLADRLLGDLEAGERVFVCRLGGGRTVADVATLAAAVRRIGPAARLLCVMDDPARHHAVLFEAQAPGLAIGYLDDPVPRADPAGLAVGSWQRLLQAAARHWGLPAAPARAAAPVAEPAPLRSFLRLPVHNRWTEEIECVLTAPTFRPGGNVVSGAAYRWDGSLIVASLRPAGLGDVRPADPVSIAPADYAAIPETPAMAIYGGHFFGMWGHFLLESLATAALADGMPQCPVIFAPFGPSVRDPLLDQDWQRCRPLLAAAGWGDRELILQSAAMRVGRLIVPERLAVYAPLPGDAVLAGEMGEIYRRVRRTIAPDARPVRPVVACRPMWSARRHPAEEQLYRLLEAQGCLLVNGVDMAPVEQVGMLAGAAVLIGFAGSNLHNSVFCHDGIPVLEIGDARSYAVPAGSDLRNPTQLMLCDLLAQRVSFIDSFHDGADTPIPCLAAELVDSLARAMAMLRPARESEPLRAFLLGGDVSPR